MDADQQRRLALELRKALSTVIADEQERRVAEEDLDAALALPAPEGDRRLTDVLASRPQTRAWMRQRDPELPDSYRLTELLGSPGPERLGTYFVCPKGDYDFIREKIGDEVPPCPVHGDALIPQD